MQAQSFDVMSGIYFALCKKIDTPMSLGAWLRFKHGEHAQLAELTLRPEWYLNARDFMYDYSIVAFLSKYEGLVTGIDTRTVALQSFAISEEKCADTNNRIKELRQRGFTPRVEGILHGARRKIAAVLGPLNLSNAMKHCGWGPGATSSLARRGIGPDIKHCEVPSVTRGALPYAKLWLQSDIHWFEAISGHAVGGFYSVLPSCFTISEGNRVVTVPKNAKTDRVIACEPTFNGFLQKGVGKWIRGRLKRFGVDLDNQGINQFWASKAHELNLATLDLKNASDTIAYELVYELLPIDWALYLDALRSPLGNLGTDEIRYHKFSSMGNAFTFELESLIFWAVTQSLSDLKDQSIVAVYGDDIICHQSISSELIDVLKVLGFEINLSKSYTLGSFYESCGKHYFNGVDVTPCYQKEEISSVDSLVRLHNRIYRLAFRSGMESYLDSTYLGTIEAIRRSAGQDWVKLVIPFHRSDGDDGFTVVRDELFHISINWNMNMGYHCKVLKPKKKYRLSIDKGLYAHTLREGSSGYFSQVQLPPTRIKPGRRWVIPSGDFEVSWI